MKYSIVILAIILSSIAAIKPISNSKDFAIGFFTGLKATEDVVDGYDCVSLIEPKMQ